MENVDVELFQSLSKKISNQQKLITGTPRMSIRKVGQPKNPYTQGRRKCRREVYHRPCATEHARDTADSLYGIDVDAEHTRAPTLVK